MNSIYSQVVDFVEANPGLLTKEIRDAFKSTNSSISAALSTARAKGVLRGEKARTPNNNKPTYRWFMLDRNASNPVRQPGSWMTAPSVSPFIASVATKASTETSLDAVVEAIAKTLADAIATRVTSLVAESLQPALASKVAHSLESPKLYPLPKEETRQAKLNVLIVGLLPAQAGEIQHEFHEPFNINFWKNEDIDRLYALTKSADAIYVMSQFISHSHIDAVRRYGSKKMYLVHGGMTSLRDNLTKLFTKE